MGTQQTERTQRDDDAARTPPRGFEPVAPGLGFSDLLAPLYLKRDGQEPPRLGFFVERHHCNPAGVCAGGMLAAVMDHALGGAVMHAAQRNAPVPTVSLSSEFISPGRLGQWLETETLSVRLKGDLGDASVVMRGPEGVIVQGTGVCKVPRQDGR